MTSKGFNTSQLIESIRAGRVSSVIDALDAGAAAQERGGKGEDNWDFHGAVAFKQHRRHGRF